MIDREQMRLPAARNTSALRYCGFLDHVGILSVGACALQHGMKKTAVTFVLLCGLTVILQQEGVFPTISAAEEEVQSSHESAGLAAEAKPVTTPGTSLQTQFPSQASENPTASPQVSPISSQPVPNPIPTPAPPQPPLPPAPPSPPPPMPIPPTAAPTVPPDNTSATASSFCSEWGPWRLEWSDDFIGDRLDPTYWQMVTSQGGYKDINFGVAGLNITACRCASCRESNVRVQDGQLKLMSERDPQIARRYYSAAVTTKDRIAWSNKDGPFRVCVRARLPLNTRGVWPAHWMLPQNGYSDQCLDEGEMDIMEMVSADGTSFNAYHWLSSWPGTRCGNFDRFHKSVSSSRKVPNYHTEFHEYAVERTGNQIQYAIDGNVVGAFSETRNRFTLSKSAFFLILNTAIGGGWPGNPDDSKTKMPV